MKNFLLVNRALAAEKNYYFLSNLYAKILQKIGGGTSRHKASIIAKQFSQYCVSQSKGAQGKNLDEKAQLSPSCPLLASSLRLTCPLQLRRVAAMIFAVLVMSMANVGVVWGTAVTWDFTNRSAATLTNGSSYSYMATDGTTEMRYSAGSSDAIVAKDKTDGYLKENGKTGDGSVKDIDGQTNLGKTRLIRLFVSGKGTLRINCNGTNGYYVVKNGSTSGTTLVASLSANTTSSEINVTTSPIWIETTTKGYINSIVWTPSTGSTWYVKGDWNSWGTATNLTGDGTTLTATATLSANTQYDFKVHNTSGEWHTNTETIKGSVTNWDFSTTGGDGNNCHIRTSCAGTYTFTYNTSTNKLSVAYPESHKVFFNKDGASWSKVYAYCFNGVDWNNGWPGYEITSNTEDHCGTEYYAYTDGYTYIIFNNGSEGVGNQTGNITVAGYEDKHAVGAAATGWTAYPTYTVTYDGNENTGGSVPTDSNSPYACSSTVTVLGNTGSLVRTGYNFTGWNTEANGSGTGYTAGKTFTISANTTLYAQWELIPTYDITYNANEGTGTTASQTGNLSGAVVATSANGFTRSGYKFKWWNTKADGSGEDFYPGEKVTIASSNVTLYAQWEQVERGWAYWVGDDASSPTDIAGNGVTMRLARTADYNTDFSAASTVVSKYNSSVDKRAKVFGIGADDKYVEISFTDGSPINSLKLGVAGKDGAYDMIVIYSTTADFSSGEGEKVVGATYEVTQSTKQVKDFSPSVANKYFYARVYRNVTTAIYGLTGGSAHTIRVYSIKAQKGVSCVAPATVNVTATVNSVAGFQFYPDDDVVLTATPTGAPAGSPVTYQWKKNGSNVGTNSATLTINGAAASDAGRYTCTISYGACSTTSAEFSLKCMQFLLKNSSGEDIGTPHALIKEDATHATLDLNLTGGTTYKFRVTDGCNNWYGNSDATGITSSNCTNWTMPHDADCKVTTNSKTGTYTFNFDFTGGVRGSEMKVSIVYPGGNQAAGKIIYWDNSVLNWEAGKQWYRIGKNGHNNKTQMELVPGTANLYTITTTAYNGFEYWHIANNDGEGTKNIFWTKGEAAHAITHAMAFEEAPVTADAVTVTPSSSHARGTSADNDNCDFYEYGQQEGMKTQNVSITAPSNGTIRVAYTDVEGASQSFTSGSADLAHTVIITPTATPAEGYTLSGLTVNEAAHTSGNTYTVTANTTIAASFTPQTYSITYLDQGGSAFSGSHADGYPMTHTYGSTTALKGATKTGYTFDGWYTSSDCSTGLVSSLGATAYTADITLYAKWTANSHTLTWNLEGGTVTTAGTGAALNATGSPSGSVNYGTTVTAPVVTKAGYTFNAWSPTVVSPMPDEDKTYTATWTAIVPSSVSLNKTSTTIEIEGTETLTATISPAVVADNTITWTSSDVTVATVTSAGVVTGVKAGTATITATTVNGKKATCEVTVAAAVSCTNEYNSPATTTYATKTFLDVSTTNYNTSVSTNYYLTYSAYWIHNTYKTWTWWNSNDADKNKESSAYTYDNATSEGYLAIASSASGNNGCGGKKIHSARRDSIWFTGATSVACLNKGNNSAFTMEVFQVASNGTLSKVGSSYTNATTNITSLVCSSLNASNYYLVKFYATTANNTYLYQVRFGNACADAPSCTTPAAPTSPTNGETTSNSQAVSWTDASNDAWEVYVSTSISTPAVDQTPTAEPTSASYTFTGLTASTTYYWWVRSVCDETHKSSWVAGSSFETSAAAGTTYYLVTSTAQLNTTDTYVIMADDKSAMMGVAIDNNAYLNAVTSGFNVAGDKSTVTVTSSDVNTLTLQAESSAWNIVGKNNKKLSTKGTVDGKLYANTDKAATSNTDDFVFEFANGKATIKRSTEANYHIYYSGSGFNQSTTATNIRLYTSNSTPVCTSVDAPTALTCSGHTSSSLTFTWTKAANASGYTASLYNNSGCTGDPVASENLGDVATVTFSTLSAETTYYCMVQSHGDGSTYCADGGTTAAQSGTTDAADVTAPTLSSSTPAKGATGVGVSGNIVLRFSENVTVNDASKFTLTGGTGTLNTASASASGAVVTIPYSGLAYNTTYTLATAAEAVKDGSNNKNAALSDITFTTLSATGSCNEQNYVWQTGSSYTPKGVSHTYAEADTAKIDNAATATTHITISGTNYAQKTGTKGSLNLAKAKNNYFLLTAASGYVIDSVYFYGKLEDGACRMSTDGSAWTTTLGDGSSIGEKVYAIGVGTQYFGLMNNDEDSPAGVWIRTMMVKVCPAGTTYTVNYDANGHGAAPEAKTGITPGSTISAPSAPTADCWTFNGWYKERACTNLWNFAEDEVHSNITLYAKWTSNKARVKGLYYGETDYTVTPAGTGDAITVTPVNASGVTYKWYSNTSDDVTGWSEIPSAETASYAPSIDEAGTKYYWAVLVHDCGNDTTSSVRINVAATKTEPTIAWGNVQLSGDETTPTYGGGGYTLTGTINAGNGATPPLTTDMISADGGIVITGKSVNDASKTFSLTFDMTAAFDTTQAKITNIHFSLPSNATYNDSVFSTNLSFDKCSGGSYSTDVYVVGYTNATGTSISSSAANKALKVAKSWISTASPSFTDKTSTDGFLISATNASFYWKQSNQTIISTTTGATMKMYKVGKQSCTIEWTNSSLSFSKVRIIGRNESADPSTVTVSNGTEEKTFTFAGGKKGELQIQEVSMEFVHGSKKGVRVKGDGAKEISAIIELVPTGSDGAGTGTPTTLQWKSGKAPSDISGWNGSAKKIVKAQSDDGFTCVAEQTSATNSVGAITYASDNTDVATVNETTGEVDIVAGAAGGEATITATMARSGCFMKSTLSYTISVPELACAIEPGTLSASATSKCKTADVTLTLSDYTTAGTTLQWYKSGTAEPLTDGSTYDIEGATMTTAEAGTYYVKVTLEETGCSLSSNNVTITNKGGAASVSKLVNQWYIKKGRVTPDIALWRLGEGSSYVASSAKAGGVALTDQLGGCTVIARDSTIYLSGGDPTGISAVGDVSLTVQVQDECGNTTTSDAITIHKQVATDKHELAFVTIGTNYKEQEFTEDAWTAGIKAANSTGLALYQVLKDTFKIQATNIYASDDEKKLREYYSQFDIICITDYPNTSTKGKNSKSYVDAIGSLIDIRPVLTMEAWVSGLDNWRNKGAVGTRTTPSKRQYNMYLQCKDHEIFEGVTMQQIGYGDDAIFKVNMVDSTQSRYAQLDAVGKDRYAEDTAALQGFTTGDMDLLAIGLIDNGSGTNLQVGAERQNVMTARMMILGVNSYAMERLSEDGMRVIVNALQYLTKKRVEDISDCSTYFTNAAGDNRWDNPANWRSGTLPYSNQEVRILQPVVVNDTRKIASVKIVADGMFQDEEARGHLTIAPTGALIVNSMIQSATGPDVFSGYPTEISHLSIQTDDLHQGALIFDNSNGATQATVSLYSKAYNDGSYKFQYFASPFMELSSWAFDAYIYTHNESLDVEWTELRYGEDVSAFQGLAITADGAARNYTIDGTLASTNPHTFNLTYTSGKANNKKGSNVIGNSWSAPIQITRIDDSDFSSPSNFEGIIYIYNAGRDVLVDGKVHASDGNSEPGQWQSIPIETAKTETWAHKRQIPAFQAFQMKVNAATEFTLDYNKHVRQEASVGVNNYNEPLHAPSRSMRAEEIKVLRLCVEDAQVGKSYIYLCEGDEFTEERDRGWEAKQTVGSGKYGKLYAIDQARDYMMSIARPSLEGTPVGFICGQSTEYTISFNETDGTYYLNDLEKQQSTLIQEGESYTFTTTKGNHPNRFIISATPFEAPSVATGMTSLDAAAPKVQKIIYNDKLYIIRGGKVYSADGQVVK